MTINLTSDLGRFISGVTFTQLPASVVSAVKMAFSDCLAVALAASKESAPRLLQKLAAVDPRGATSWLDGERLSAADAAWVNGTAAHALDYDDVAQRGGHVSACIVPAILAEAEVLSSSGADIIAAYVAGYEVVSELVRRDKDDHFSGGWHPTSVFGAIGAAAACASLRKLDAERASSSIAIAASQSCGVVSNFGTMTKPMHAGNAARAGVISARLAESGFNGSHQALEAKPGFLSAISPLGRLDLDAPMLAGHEWQIVTTNRIGIKKYPLCYCAHRAVDGVLDLIQKYKIGASDVDQIVISMSPRNAAILKQHAPRTSLEAKFSVEFSVSAALIAGRVGLAELEDAFVNEPAVQSMIARVSIDNSDKESSRDRVVLKLVDGRTLDSGPIEAVRGDANSPLGLNELYVKFEDCVRLRLTKAQASRMFAILMQMDGEVNLGGLIAMLRCSSPLPQTKGAA